MIFVGVDWAEDHHDVCVMDRDGTVLGKRRVAEGPFPSEATVVGSYRLP